MQLKILYRLLLTWTESSILWKRKYLCDPFHDLYRCCKYSTIACYFLLSLMCVHFLLTLIELVKHSWNWNKRTLEKLHKPNVLYVSILTILPLVLEYRVSTAFIKSILGSWWNFGRKTWSLTFHGWANRTKIFYKMAKFRLHRK